MLPQALTSSESNEWYTPQVYIERVRRVIGDIDLDPASTPAANLVVQAHRILTCEEDALSKAWIAKNVFLNPPYGKVKNKSQAGLFCAYMLDQHKQANFPEGIILVNACTGSKWFRPLFDESICFVDHRIRYDVPPGHSKKNQPTKDNVFVYVGADVELFASEFGEIGRIRVASKYIKRYVNGVNFK